MLAALVIADEDEAGESLAEGRVAGRSLLQLQIDAVISAGASRIIFCGGEDRLIDQIRAAENEAARRQVRFDTVTRAREAASLLSREDEVLVLAPGLLVQPEALAAVLPGEPGLLTVPADSGVPQGFERIDLSYAWAGVSRIPAPLLSRLAQVPPDWQASSALLRIAAQEGVPLVPLRADLVNSPAWHLLKDRQAFALAEDRFVAARLNSLPRRSWSAVIVRGLVGQLGTPLLEARVPIVARVLAPVISGMLALTACATGHWFIGLGCLLLSWFLTLAVLDLRTLQISNEGQQARPVAANAFDLLLGALVAVSLHGGGETWGIAAAHSAVLLFSMRLASRTLEGRVGMLLADRGLWIAGGVLSVWALGPLLGLVALAATALAWCVVKLERTGLTGL